MGLGWVRDLRRRMVKAIVAERGRGPFTDLRSLVTRVPLQRKEPANLIRCGALDGLGDSRAALLAESREMQSAGSALQLPLAFDHPKVRAESVAQRLDWERQVLGYPVSGLRHPLELVEERLADRVSLRQLPDTEGRAVTVAGVRLPGWTGGRGFYLWDGETWVIARGSKSLKAPPPWEPVVLHGRWTGDEWGFSWLQVQSVRSLKDQADAKPSV